MICLLRSFSDLANPSVDKEKLISRFNQPQKKVLHFTLLLAGRRHLNHV
jgi:hypothetical protein